MTGDCGESEDASLGPGGGAQGEGRGYQREHGRGGFGQRSASLAAKGNKGTLDQLEDRRERGGEASFNFIVLLSAFNQAFEMTTLENLLHYKTKKMSDQPSDKVILISRRRNYQ